MLYICFSLSIPPPTYKVFVSFFYFSFLSFWTNLPSFPYFAFVASIFWLFPSFVLCAFIFQPFHLSFVSTTLLGQTFLRLETILSFTLDVERQLILRYTSLLGSY